MALTDAARLCINKMKEALLSEEYPDRTFIISAVELAFQLGKLNCARLKDKTQLCLLTYLHPDKVATVFLQVEELDSQLKDSELDWTV